MLGQLYLYCVTLAGFKVEGCFHYQAYKVGWPVYQIGLAKSYAIGSKKHLSRDKYKERRYTRDKYKEG